MRRLLVIPVMAVGLFFSACAFGEAEGPPWCGITAIGADAKYDDKGNQVDSYDYRFQAGSKCGDAHVTASYNMGTQEARENSQIGATYLRAVWRCAQDPWIIPDADCSFVEAGQNGYPNALELIDFARDADLPLSVYPLIDADRGLLKGQYFNAIDRLAKTSQAAPQPAPAPKVVTPPQVSPFVVLNVDSNDGPYVEALQYLLRHHGADVAVDGNFGEQTEAAVRAFQGKQPMTVNGAVGLSTWEALWVTVGIGKNSDAVSAVQTLLNAHGFDVDVDGDFGEATRAVVLDFQDKKGLIEGGVVDEKIWRALIAPPKRP